MKKSSSKLVLLYSFLFVLSILPFCNLTDNQKKNINIDNELFSPELMRLNSVQKFTKYTDSVYNLVSKQLAIDTGLYVKITSDIVKQRFYHGLSNYSISDNWIAALSGKILWSHMSAIVDPNDILKHPEGLCSQQTIVFLEVLKQKGIIYRTVGLGYREGPGHFLSEVSYNGSWHLHDVNKEPKWEKVYNHHKSLDYYLHNKDSLFLAYEGLIDKKLFFKIMEKAEYGKPNHFPAKNMLLFHKITKLLTYIIPILLFMLIFLKIKKSKL